MINASYRISSYNKNIYLYIMKKIIFTDKAPAPIGPYSQAVAFGNMLYTSGQIALHPQTGELVTSDIETETKQVMENMKAVLEAAGTTFENVIKSTIFISNMDDFAKINGIYGAYFNEKTAPARETVQVAKLPKNVNVEISMIVAL
jgi:2-iminobutanoate/2-iminopropanoate deaminase